MYQNFKSQNLPALATAPALCPIHLPDLHFTLLECSEIIPACLAQPSGTTPINVWQLETIFLQHGIKLYFLFFFFKLQGDLLSA